LESIGGGVTMANVSKGKFESLDIVLPITPMLRNFDEFCRPIFSQIKVLMQQNQKLRTARDLLLPRLMSGEIAI
jgi:type I restriction enzyme S subunit